ncbi:hypothetical protein SeLEV6574_g00312 [Synchytrium endobioticum]|nr:hypothetical protein SeLEV6574_g00312 [Synchytrium endobioticum]
MATWVAKPEAGRSFLLPHQTSTAGKANVSSRRPSALALLSLSPIDPPAAALPASPPHSATKRSFLERVWSSASTSRPSLDSPSGKNEHRGANHYSLKEKYGKCRSLLGKGSSGHCYAVKRPSDEQSFCVKEFRKRRDDESEREYIKKLTAEYCIGSLLHHENIIETIDIIFEKDRTYEVMELCAGGDLFEAIQENNMTMAEVDCCFAQLLHGVDYLHKMGICHRDLKPENCLFDSRNHLKIIDFGSADVVKSPFDKICRKSYGRCGSGPYMPPEEFTDATYDGTKVDVWACAVIYIAMVFQRFPWQTASPSDPNYKAYLAGNFKCKFFDRLPEGPRQIIRHMLTPDPDVRPTIAEVLADPWIKSLELCEACGGHDPKVNHHHGKLHQSVPDMKGRSISSSSVRANDRTMYGAGSTPTPSHAKRQS